MNCVKDIYELFGETGPNLTYESDQIWYLGYSYAQSVYPYINAPQDVVLQTNTPAFDYPEVSLGGGPSVDLLSSNFGGFMVIPDETNSYQGVLLSDGQTLNFIVGEYCIPTTASADPYLNDGNPSQPGFYFFMRRVENNDCIAFSPVQVLQVGIGAELPEDHTIDAGCELDPGLDCFDITKYLNPAHPSYTGGTATCMYPPYNDDYWNVADPTCVDITVAGQYVYTYTVPASALSLIFSTDPNCLNCGLDDLVITLTISIGGAAQTAPPIQFCN